MAAFKAIISDFKVTVFQIHAKTLALNHAL